MKTNRAIRHTGTTRSGNAEMRCVLNYEEEVYGTHLCHVTWKEKTILKTRNTDKGRRMKKSIVI